MIIDPFLIIFFSGKTSILWIPHLTSHGLGLLKLFVLCDGQISWSETIAFLLDFDQNASPSAEISIWHGLVLYRVSLKSVKLSKLIFFCRINFFIQRKKLHLQNLAKHPIFHIVNFEFIYGIKCVGELIAFTVET